MSKNEGSAFGRFWEGFAPWAPYLLAGLVLAALYAALQMDATVAVAAEIIAFGAPAVAVGSVLVKMIGAPARPRNLVSVTLAVAFVMCAVLVMRTIHPTNLLGNVTVSGSQLDAQVNVPANASRFVLYTKGSLVAHAGAGEGTYTISVSRGAATRWVHGKVSREVGQSRRMMRRAAPSRVMVAHTEQRHEVDLPGSGPVKVHFYQSSRSARREVGVEVLAYDPMTDALQWLLVALAIAAIFIESLVAAQHLPVPVSGAVGFCAVFGIYFAHVYEPSDVQTAVFGGIVIAIVVGVGVGFTLGFLVSRFLAPKLEARA